MEQRILENVRIVLVGTTHPGNIGASARAMKTMGLRSLVLVSPKQFPCAEATAMASGSDDILAAAEVCRSLEQGVRGCGLVIATSARSRSIPWPELQPVQCAERLLQEAAHGPVALVFGREHSGLSNLELEHCQAMVQIPTDPEFRSLNLAASVQILAYELRMQLLETAGNRAPSERGDAPPASYDQMQDLYEHLQNTMTAVGFYDPARPRRLMRRLKRLFNRSALDNNEVQILRGFLAAVDDMLNRKR